MFSFGLRYQSVHYTDRSPSCGAGKSRDLTCGLRILTTSKEDAVEHFLESDVYRQSGLSLHPKTVEKCICPCIKPIKRGECACPICGEFAEALRAYHRARQQWHDADDCTCTGSCGLECKVQSSEFRSFSRNHGTFEQAIRCPKRAHEELCLPHDSQPPEFYKLTCCLRHKRDSRMRPNGTFLPDFARCK